MDGEGKTNEQTENGFEGISSRYHNEPWKEKEIWIEVESIENIDATKVKEIAIKLEFKGQVFAESENITIPETGECTLNISGFIPVEDPSPQIMDDILANPILFTVIDRTMPIRTEKDIIEQRRDSKKDSKKAASRASMSVKSIARSSIAAVPNILGMCNMDLGPLIKGQKLIKEKIILELGKNTYGQNVVSWPKLPRLNVIASTGNEELIPANLNRLNNIIDITVESVYNVPGNVEEGASFDATILIPTCGEKMEALTFSNGILTCLKDGECMKRWQTLSHVEGRGSLTKNRISQNTCDIVNPENEIPDLQNEMSENGLRIQWNKWRSSIMVKTGSNQFFAKLSKYRVWPIEISFGPRPMSQKTAKTEKRARTASTSATSMPERYVAYLRLGSLLYPGVTRVRVAGRLYTYSTSDISEKCGPEFIQQSFTNNSFVRTKTGDKTKSSGKEPEETKDISGSPLLNEKGKPVFVVVEVEVWKPYMPKREPDYFYERFNTYFPLRGKVVKKQMNVQLARQNFTEAVEKLSCTINESYRNFITGKNSGLDSFLKHLCMEELFQKLKITLEDKIVDLVGETYGSLGTENDKLPEIFVYLVEEIHKITNNLMTYKTRPVKSHQIEANDLQLSAEEAIEEGNYNLARRYLLQKISINKLNPDYWLDYALYLLILEDYEKSAEAVREALLLDMQHQMGLLMYGLILVKMKNFYVAELTFQVLLAKYPNFIEGWMILHFFYSTVGNMDGAEYSLQMACRLDCEEKIKELSSRGEAEEFSNEDDPAKKRPTEFHASLAEGKYGIPSFFNGRNSTDPLSWTLNLGIEYTVNVKTAILLLQLRCFEFAELALMREGSTKSLLQSLQYTYYLSVSHYLQGQYNEALLHLQAAVENYGKNCFLWSLMGHCYYKIQTYDNAIDCFNYVIESYNRPDDIHLIYVRMGIYYMKTNKYKCAKKMFLCGCKYSPSSETWLGLGAACYNLGEFEEAESALTEANFLDYLCPVVWAYLTLVNIQLERYDIVELCYTEVKKKNLKDQRLIDQIETMMEVHRLKNCR